MRQSMRLHLSAWEPLRAQHCAVAFRSRSAGCAPHHLSARVNLRLGAVGAWEGTLHRAGVWVCGRFAWRPARRGCCMRAVPSTIKGLMASLAASARARAAFRRRTTNTMRVRRMPRCPPTASGLRRVMPTPPGSASTKDAPPASAGGPRTKPSAAEWVFRRKARDLLWRPRVRGPMSDPSTSAGPRCGWVNRRATAPRTT